MTDIELLPLPKWLLEGFTDPTIERLCDYTRANVEHYVKELQEEVARVRGLWGDAEILGHKLYDQNAAKDAEIERLRVEAIEWRGLFDMAKARADKAEARAERLAEALRNSSDTLERLAFAIRAPNAHTPQLVELAIAMRATALAALRDHDQEVGNG